MVFERKARANYAGFDGPYFPQSIDKINVNIETLGHNIHGYFLEALCQQIPGFKEVILRPKTADGYCWFVALSFGKWSNSDNQPGVVIVLLPRQGEGRRKQRSIAVYTKGVGQQGGNEIVERLSTVIDQHLIAQQNRS